MIKHNPQILGKLFFQKPSIHLDIINFGICTDFQHLCTGLGYFEEFQSPVERERHAITYISDRHQDQDPYHQDQNPYHQDQDPCHQDPWSQEQESHHQDQGLYH